MWSKRVRLGRDHNRIGRSFDLGLIGSFLFVTCEAAHSRTLIWLDPISISSKSWFLICIDHLTLLELFITILLKGWRVKTLPTMIPWSVIHQLDGAVWAFIPANLLHLKLTFTEYVSLLWWVLVNLIFIIDLNLGDVYSRFSWMKGICSRVWTFASLALVLVVSAWLRIGRGPVMGKLFRACEPARVMAILLCFLLSTLLTIWDLFCFWSSRLLLIDLLAASCCRWSH